MKIVSAFLSESSLNLNRSSHHCLLLMTCQGEAKNKLLLMVGRKTYGQKIRLAEQSTYSLSDRVHGNVNKFKVASYFLVRNRTSRWKGCYCVHVVAYDR